MKFTLPDGTYSRLQTDSGVYPATGKPARLHSAVPYKYDGTPRRDERFPDQLGGATVIVFLGLIEGFNGSKEVKQ